VKVIRTRKYLKSLDGIPRKARDRIEAEVDRLETDLTGVRRILGTDHQARLEVGDYRVHLVRQVTPEVALIVEAAVRRTTTTYRKRA